MALSHKGIRIWFLIHKWSSLICMVFMLMLCLTGLPLIFHQEINDLTHPPEFSDKQADDTQANLNTIMHKAKSEHPEWTLIFMFWDSDAPKVSAVLGPTMDAGEGEASIIPFDEYTGERLQLPPVNKGVMAFLLDLHASMLLGLPGTLFLGLMGLVLMLSIISGVIIYAPFMRRLPFAIVRKDRSKRLQWLDTHNMVSMVTLAWLSVVSITGIILTLVTPLTALWQHDQLAQLTEPYKNTEPTANPVTPDIVMASIKSRIPDADISFMSWPGSPFSTPHHYNVALRGKTPLTERLLTLAFVDAGTGEITNIVNTPWYITTINLSIPLHFGDYGGMPLKIIWALLDIAAIIVLMTGLYLWIKRYGKTSDAPAIAYPQEDSV